MAWSRSLRAPPPHHDLERPGTGSTSPTRTRLPRWEPRSRAFDPRRRHEQRGRGLRVAASGTDPKAIAPEIEIDQEVDLAPGESATIWQREGAGTGAPARGRRAGRPRHPDRPSARRRAGTARWSSGRRAPLDDRLRRGPWARRRAKHLAFRPRSLADATTSTSRCPSGGPPRSPSGTPAARASRDGGSGFAGDSPASSGQRLGYFHAVRGARYASSPTAATTCCSSGAAREHVVGVVL